MKYASLIALIIYSFVTIAGDDQNRLAGENRIQNPYQPQKVYNRQKQQRFENNNKQLNRKNQRVNNTFVSKSNWREAKR